MKTTFSKIAERYLANRVVAPIYAANVRRIAARCGAVTVDRMNEFLRERLEVVAGTTVRTERTILLSLWKWAYEYEACGVSKLPRGVFSIKAKRAPTRAWTLDQVRTLVSATHDFDGLRFRRGASLGLFLRAWVFLGYESGSRFGDLMAMRREHIEGDCLRWTQSKTGDPIHKVLSPACLDAVRAMLEVSSDGRILGWACRPRQAQRHMRALLDKAGIGGTSKWLRRSGATHIEMAHPGKASLHLGHRTATLAAQAYIDWSQVRKTIPQTPSLLDAS